MTNTPFNNSAAKPDAGRPSTKISDLKPGRNLFYYLCDLCICWPDQSYEIEWLAKTSGNNTGSRNTAIGRGASYNNTSGERNTAVGFDALNNNQTGILNTAVGSYALVQLVSGEDNTAFGREALANLGKITESGRKTFYNTAIGSNAGVNLGLNSTENNNNTFLGANSDVESNSTSYSNSTAVGASSVITKSDQLVLGTSSVETYIAGTLSINSQNIKNNELTISDENGTLYTISLTKV